MERPENIQVALRFRPLNRRELRERDSLIWRVTENSVQLKPEWQDQFLEVKRISTPISKAYGYNYCFKSKTDNLTLYTTVVKRIVLASLEGYNGTVFAYGQTGSGKTYTMMGSDGAELDCYIEDTFIQQRERTYEARRSVSPSRLVRSLPVSSALPILRKASKALSHAKGIIELSLEDLFSSMQSCEDKTFCLTCSYMEIYNERVYDLLVDQHVLRTQTLTVGEDMQRGFYVKNLSEHVVNSLEEVLQLIEGGENNRHYAATAMNHHSSRSHTIFRINVTSVGTISTKEMREQLRREEDEDLYSDIDDSTHNLTTESILNFVDLAGSERASNLQESSNPIETTVPCKGSVSQANWSFRGQVKRQVTPQKAGYVESLMNEGKYINSSLFYLTQVITKLSEKGSEAHVPYRNSNLTKILRSSLGGNALTCVICTATPTPTQFEMTLSTLRFGGIAQTIRNQVVANIRSDKNAEILAVYQRGIEELKRQLSDAEQGGRARAEEAIKMKAQLEDRIQKLTSMLFKRTKTEIVNKKEVVPVNLWCRAAGHLFVDPKLEPALQSNTPDLRFDERGEFALRRMYLMRKERAQLESELKELRDTNRALADGHTNVRTRQLKRDLKRLAEQFSQTSVDRQHYKQLASQSVGECELMKCRLALVTELKGVEARQVKELLTLERFLYTSLDAAKVRIIIGMQDSSAPSRLANA
jgi:centromeric protein E